MIAGTNGNDTLTGTESPDLLEGFGGDDVLNGGGGPDVTNGGLGDDVHIVGTIDDIVLEAVGEGRDRVYTTFNYNLRAGVEVELLIAEAQQGLTAINLGGNEFDNILYGNQGANVLSGVDGNDGLIGYAGDDVLDGGGGGDITNGGLGNDIHLVDSLDDIVLEAAGEGRDLVYANTSYVLRTGVEVELLLTQNQAGTAAINLSGNEFANIIHGNAGQNSLSGGGGADGLIGYAGNDVLDGGTGADVTNGGLGDDIHLVDSIDDIVLEASGEGRDLVYSNVNYHLRSGVEVELLLTQNQAGTAAINLSGNEFGNIIHGNQGANVLGGGGGDDGLLGYAGDDVLDGGTGADITNGGGGNDIHLVDSLDDIVLEGAGEGRDLVYASTSYTLREGVEVELLLTANQSGTSAINLSGNAIANIIYGNQGANVLSGGGGDDGLLGYAGNDVLDGGAGADITNGGLGDDIHLVDSFSDIVLEAAGEGRDLVYASSSYALRDGVEAELLLTADQTGTTAIDLIGNSIANIIHGNQGANLLSGGGGSDLLFGYGGADSFAFTTALDGVSNVDSIADFQVSLDRILLGGEAGQPFVALASGALGAGSFRIGSAAADADDRIIYNSATGGLFYDADGVGAAAAVQFASLSSGLSLNAGHFVVAGAPNSNPVITSGAASSVQENAPVSTIVYQATATDADGDSISYSISGQHADRFSIDQTGAVRLLNPADYETLNSYNFTVTAQDSSGQGSSRDVTLSIVDVNDTTPPPANPYVINDTESNNSIGTAQALNRALFTPLPDSTAPDGSLPTARINGSISPGADADFFSVTLQAGELLVLDVDGTNSLDALVRIVGPDGKEVAMNDDAVAFDPGSSAHSGVSHNLDSLVSFRAPTSGTYTFSIQSFADDTGPTSSGSYSIYVSIGPVASQAQINEENVQALMSGASWSNLNVTFGFTTAASQYGTNEGTEEKGDNFEALNATQRAAVRQMLTQISGFTNLVFSELTSNPGSAQMRYAMSGNPETAHASYPGFGDGGDSWYGNDGTTYDNPVIGNYAWMTFLHESGHALGLKHGHESPALSPDRDSMEYSAMTYRGYIGAPTDEENGGYKNETFGFAQTLMMYDIAALQQLYGADFTTNADNSTYSWNPLNGSFLINGGVQWTPGGNRVFMTIWDGGGTDTYDLSNYTSGVTIDLRPGEWTTTSAVQLANLGLGNIARGNVANALLHEGDTRSLIENAVGGTGNDTLIANQAANRLTGGAGADTFRFASNSDVGTGSLRDMIADFLSSSDKIDLSGIDANSNAAGDQAFTFVGANAFTNSAGQLRSETAGGSTTIFGDTNGDGVADFSILLENTATITSGDFVL